jgi:Flp pilus assembly pilin Flp
MTNLLKNFAKDESGAVTVDWVVLTAAIVGLGLLVITAVRPGIETLSTNISSAVGETCVGVDCE